MNNELLWDFADGLLEPAEHANVAAQLQRDPALRAQLAEVQRERAQLLAAVPLESPRPGFTDAVMAAWVAEQMGQKAQARQQHRDWRVLAVPMLLGGGVLVAMVTLLALILRSTPLASLKAPAIQWQAPALPTGWLTDVAGSGSVQVVVCLVLTVLLLRLADKFWLQRQFV